MHQLSTLVWLKWMLFRNSLRKRKAVVSRLAGAFTLFAAFLLSLIIALGVGGLAYALTVGGGLDTQALMPLRQRATGPSPTVEFIFFSIFSLCYLLWATLPLSIGGGRQFDPGNLMLYPISLKKLFALDFLSEIATLQSLMAIPAILLAIAMVSLFRAGVFAVIAAIAVPEIPRVVRLVRSIVLGVREEPYVEAAVTLGTPSAKLIWRHVLPNTIAPLIVQGTFTCASAILVEAILSFLGIGVPPEVPTWGNIMAEGRQVFSLYPHNIIYPGIMLAATILAVNALGDGLRDTLDPKMAKRV